MGDALGAIAAVLGGGALGGAAGLGNVMQHQQQQKAFAYQHQQDEEQKQMQLKQLFLQREQLDHQIKDSTDARQRQVLLDEQKKIDDWAKNLAGAGITLGNPTSSYKHAMANPNSLVALQKAAEAKATALAQNNRPLGVVEGTDYDQFGGATVENRTFSPYGYMAAQTRVSGASDKLFATQIAGARNRILRARDQAISAFKQSSGMGATLASVQDPAERQRLQDTINSYGDQQALISANAELTALRTAFPNDPRLDSLTAEALLAGTSGGPQTPSGASAADPLGLFSGAPGAGVNQPPATSSPAAPAADPLGLGRTPPPRPATAGPQNNDPLGILRRPPGF